MLQSLLGGLSDLLRLPAITCEALLNFEATTPSGFRAFFEVSCGAGHGALQASVWGCGGGRLPKRG